MDKMFIEKSLKRFIKREKIGYSISLLVSFLITGNVCYSQILTNESISYDENFLREKIAENNKRIGQKIFELLQKGDYFAKTLEDNNQFFFPLNYEHRHAGKSHFGHFIYAGKPNDIIPGIPIIPPGEPGGPTTTKPWEDIIPPGKPGGPITTKPWEEIIPQEQPGGSIIRPEKPVISHKIETVEPEIPKLPEKSEGQTTIKPLELGEIKKTVIENFIPKLAKEPAISGIKKGTIAQIDPVIKPIPLDNLAVDSGPNLTIDIAETNFSLNRPNVQYEYDPKEPTAPSLPQIDELKAPAEIKLPELNINTTKFDQGTGGIMRNNADTEAVVENYGKYETKGEGIEITFKDVQNSDGTMKNKISYKGVEEGNLVIHTVDKVNKDENKQYANQEVILKDNTFRTEYLNDKTKPGATGETATFISTTMGKDSLVDGKYTLNYAGSDWNNATRSFLSVNTAGMLNKQSGATYDSIGKADGSKVDDRETREEKKAILTDFKGNLILKNRIEDSKKYGSLVGIDHQLWDIQTDNQVTSDEYRKSYSIAKNSGVINLGMEDGQDKNLVGISIETEDDNGKGRTKHKIHNHVTLNANEININGTNSIGIGFEDGADVADDLYVGKINLKDTSKESYGLRLKNSNKNKSRIQYNSVRVFGSVSDNINLSSDINASGEDLNLDNKINDQVNGKDEVKKIVVAGNNNGGVVIAKSLSNNATKYLNKDKYLSNKNNHGDDMPTYNGAKPEEYLGVFADDIKVNKDGQEVIFEGYDNGKVDPIANVHGLNIEVDGITSVGFLRHRDYSDNNKNDMVITNTSTSAIKEIDFGKNASGSVLVRSDMYGINLEKDLIIDKDGLNDKKVEIANTIAEQKPQEDTKNIILQATRSIWEKAGQEIKSIGHIINSGNLLANTDNVVGMMANDVKKYDEQGNEIKQDFNIANGLNGYNGIEKYTYKYTDKNNVEKTLIDLNTSGKSIIKNSNNITINGKDVIGMAVLGENVGILENGKINTTMNNTKTIAGEETTVQKSDYNVSIYNDGEFAVVNSEVVTSGDGSVALYNKGITNLVAEEGKSNKIIANGGAIALYSNGGKIEATEGKVEINSETAENKNDGGIGIFGYNGANITIGKETSSKNNEKTNNIVIKNGAAGIASKGENTVINLNDTNLSYTGNGYALYDEDGGTINIKNSTINLDGKSAGMKVNWGKGNNNIHFDKDSKIKVNSNDVVVFNIISGEAENEKLKSNLSELKDDIAKQLEIDSGNLDEKLNLKDLIEVEDDVTKYKEAMVDGGSLAIDKSISQTDGKNTDGEFYFKRFLGTRLNTTVNNGVKVTAEIDSQKANNDYEGKVTGLEIVSSKNATNLDDTASITLKKDSEVIANRLEKIDTKPTEEQIKNHATVGVFTNFAKLNMEDGSKVIVEKVNDATKDTANNGVGIFAVNGSVTNIGNNYNEIVENENAKIEVFGDKSVGVYAKASREENDQILDNEYGAQKEQGFINVTNNGVIDVSNGVGSIGISAYNNYNSDDKIGHSAEDNYVVNNGLIKVGDSNKVDSSVGIYGDKVTIKNNKKIEVGNGEREKGENGIINHYGGVGIFASKGSIVNKIGELVLGDYATGVVVDGTSEITDRDELKFQTDKQQHNGVNKIGIAYNNNGRTKTREHNFDISADNKVSGLRAIASESGILNINSNITLGDNDNRGVIVSDGTVLNRSTITINDSGNELNDTITSVGMGASGKESTISNIGTINLNGTENTGVYIKNYGQDLNLNDFVKENEGIKFGEQSKDSTGVHIYGSNITIDEDIHQNLENSNILLKATKGSKVINDGTLTITSTKKSDKVIGVVLDEHSKYNGTGKIRVEGGAIGLYSKIAEPGKGEKEFNNLKLDLVSQGQNAIGLALKGTSDKENSMAILNGTTEIKLLSASQSPQVEPDQNQDVSENKGVGIIVDNTDLILNKMELEYQGTSGIGIYLKNDALLMKDIDNGLLHIYGTKGSQYSVGVYANEDSGNPDTGVVDIGVDIAIDKEKAIGVFNSKEHLVYNGKIDVDVKDSVGIFNDIDKQITLQGKTNINVTGGTKEGEASVGVSAKENSIIVNKGNITTNGVRDAGIYGENTQANNQGIISVNGGTGVFLRNNDSILAKSSSFNGMNGTISTAKDNNSQTAIHLENGAKIEEIGNLNLGKGDIGIYAGHTEIDGSKFKTDFVVSGNEIKDGEIGAIGIATENSTVENLNMKLEDNAIGVVGLNGKIDASNIDITSDSTKGTVGIYLGKKEDASIQKNEIKDFNFNIKDGYGIIMQDSESGKGTDLTVTGVEQTSQDPGRPNFTITTSKGNEKASAVYVGDYNKFTSQNNSYSIINSVGIYGKYASTINLLNDDLTLIGKSTGIYSQGGIVNIAKDTTMTAWAVDKVNGGAVYVDNGIISNNGIIGGIASNFYGLALNGKGQIKNGGIIALGGGNNTGISFNGNLENKDNLIDNSGTVAVEGIFEIIKDEQGNKKKVIKRTTGIYGKNTNILNTGKVGMTDHATGIIYDNTQGRYQNYNLNSTGDIIIQGTDSVGAVLKGNAGDIHITNIEVQDKIEGKNIKNNMGIYANNFKAGSFKVDNIAMKDNSIGIYFYETETTANIGNVSVGNGVKENLSNENEKDKASIAIGVFNGDVNLNIEKEVKAGFNGTALFNQGGKVTIDDFTKLSVDSVKNGVEQDLTTHSKGSLIHSKGGEVVLQDVGHIDKYEVDINGYYGFILENGGKIHGTEDFKKKDFSLNVRNNGTGIIFIQTDGNTKIERPFSDLGVSTVKVEGSTDPNNKEYTKGLYYKNLGEIEEDLSDINIKLSGKNTVGLVLNGTYGTIQTKDVVIGEEAQNSTAILVKGSDDYKENPINPNNVTTITGNITVKDGNRGGGEQKTGNIGLEVQNASASTSGNITVGEGFDFAVRYPVGVYAINNIQDKDGNLLEDRDYIYTGNGDLTVGNFATGVAAKNFDILYNGNITVGVGAIGILADNENYRQDKNYTTVFGNITVGDEKVTDRSKGIGVYGKNTNITIGLKDSAIDMNIKNNEENIGVLSVEKGDIEFNGNVNIAGSADIKRGDKSVVGIYKTGSGNVEIAKGDWSIGENSFGIVTKAKDEKINLTNDADINIQKGSVGIYSQGNTLLLNKGNLVVNGNGLDSTVGIYMENDGKEISKGINEGTINVEGKNSVGIQAVGKVEFTNSKDGIINVSDNGIGMYAADGATIQNDGVINLGKEDGKDSTKSIGMYGEGQGTNIINNGTINANHGTGMYVEDGATLTNNKDINIKNGIGIKGNGNFINKGNIYIEKGYNGILEDTTAGNNSSIDKIIKIENDVVIIGTNYTGIGGNLDSDFNLKLDNPTIDITTGNGLGLNAPDISGGITVAPNFATTGNGYKFDIKDFSKDDVNLDVNTSPLFNGEISKGDLSINKVAYKDIMKDYQYKNFYNSLDKTLQVGAPQDIEALKNLNTYLESFGNSPEFYSEYKRVMGEAQGSVYSHVQSRMQDVDRAFNNAFDEMEQSYNLSKDTEKFSVIYTNGDYKNHNTELPNYEYRTTGLLFMREFEDLEYNNKNGYTFGFTGSRFKFDDTGKSKEDIYSLKGGLHNVKSFDKDLDLLTKLEVGLNYHDTERKLTFGSHSYKNNAEYYSYHLSLDNKFRKTFYKDYQNQFVAYIGAELEYGRFTDIKEDGTLALDVKGNDYLSTKAVIGVNGVGRKYIGKDWTAKLSGDIGYSYDFGENYDSNKSKLKNSNDGRISLMNELETRGRATAKVGIGFERLNHLGVTLEGEVAKDFNRDEDYWRVGLRFNYKFNKEDIVTTLRNTFNFKDNHFDFDKDTLTRPEQKIIDTGSKIINDYNLKGTLALEGHTDNYGTVKYNQGLSERRAEAVKKEFEKKIKNREHIKYTTKGYSELKPVDTNATKEGRANNRRAEVKFLQDVKVNKTR